MIRNLKMLGLAICAMLVLGAMPSAATAAEFHSEAATTELHGEQPAAFNDKITTDAGSVECKAVTYTGTVSGATTSTASLVPAYTECTGTFGMSVTVDVNGCEYVFHTSPDAPDFDCPANNFIEVTSPGCIVTIPPQQGLNGTSYSSNAGKSDITIKISANNVKYEEHGKGFFPTCKNKTVLTSNGTLSWEATVTGRSGGKAVNFWYA